MLLSFVVAGVALGSLYALSGVGLVLLYRATGVLNLGYGAVGALCALIGWELSPKTGPVPPALLLLIIVLTTLIMLLYGVFIGPLLAHREAVVKATATLGLALACLGIANWKWNDKGRTLNLPTDKTTFDVFGVTLSLTQLLAFLLALAVTILASWLLKVTVTGTNMRALANDRELASMLGVPVRRVEALAWGISGAICGISTIFLADLSNFSAGWLTFLVVPALAAALVGRLISLWATLIGGIIIGVLESVLQQFDSLNEVRTAVPFVVAILVTLWQARKKVYVIGRAA